jgi:hypothetical protein
MITEIRSIPYGQQRYPTLGDYETFADGSTYITVTEMPDWRHEFLIAIHELIEEAVTRHRGIYEEDIMAWDKLNLDDSDPGMLDGAPYHREHVSATAIEMLVADMLDVRWCDYGKACEEVTS